MNQPDISQPGDELLAAMVDMLQQAGDGVTIDLTEDPPVLVARTAGRIFAAAWPAERGLHVRLRLDSPPDDVPEYEALGSGTLEYESVVHTRRQLAEVVDMLREAHTVGLTRLNQDPPS